MSRLFPHKNNYVFLPFALETFNKTPLLKDFVEFSRNRGENRGSNDDRRFINALALLSALNPCVFKLGRSREAHQQRSHTRQQEELCLRLGGMLKGRKTLQGSVYARCAHEKTHWGKTAQVYRKHAHSFLPFGSFLYALIVHTVRHV